MISSLSAYDVIIIGGGPAGLSCAIYLGRAGIKTCVLEGAYPGGMIAKSHFVENWPGEEGISGIALAENIRKQAQKNGAVLLVAEALSVDFTRRPYAVVAQELYTKKTRTFKAPYMVIAMGSSPNFLNIPGENTYFGKGVSTCAVCDGAFYAGKKVAIVGGGDSAILDADYLSNIAEEVHIFVRKPFLKATEIRRKNGVLAKKNVFLHRKAVLEKILGDDHGVTSIQVMENGQPQRYSVHGVFLAIGSKPNTELFRKKVSLTPSQHIAIDASQETSKKGVYAIGDIVDPIYQQAICAAGDGAKAAINIQRSLGNDLVAAENVEASH